MAKTSSPISSISYNTKEFLILKLNSLIYQGYLSYWEFIEHLPDTDDKKRHIHLYCVPNKSLDLVYFKNLFDEAPKIISEKYINIRYKYITNNIKLFCCSFGKKFVYQKIRYAYYDCRVVKPLKCLPFRKSKYGDWYWYGLHNPDYLRSKLLERNTFYKDCNIICSDLDNHKLLVQESPLYEFAKMGDYAIRDFIITAIENNTPLDELIKSGYIPLQKLQSAILFYNTLYSATNERNKEKILISSKDYVKNSKKNNIANKFNTISDENVVQCDFIDELF